VSAQYQSSRIFRINLSVDFNALYPEHHLLHDVAACTVHSLVERNQSPLKFCTHLETWSDKELCDVDITVDMLLQQPYHSHCRNLYSTMSAHSAFENVQCIVHKTSLQHNTTTLTEAYKQTEHHTVTAMLPHHNMLVHKLIMELNRHMVYTFFV
jgi:hypothetical protein